MESNIFYMVKKILLIILIANFIVAFLKIIIGAMIKSSSIMADGFHSLSDGSSNIVGLIGVNFASKPKDIEHPYGHYKFETLSGLFISFMLFTVGLKVIFNAIERFKNPVVMNISMVSMIILFFTLVINIIISVTEYKKGIDLKSSILISDSMHTRCDIYISTGVIFTLIAIKIGAPPVIDPIASLIVSALIIHAAYEIFKENADILVDKSAVSTEEIRNLVMNFELVKDTHKIRSRGNNNFLYIDLHILVEPDLSIEESHILVHNIEEVIKTKINNNTQIMAHLEPYTDLNFNKTLNLLQ